MRRQGVGGKTLDTSEQQLMQSPVGTG